ncbi:hypothetical protein DPMN_078229 [Dreissena polymorpha]|uniref:Glutamate decarboxylase n=1 Tax=Dreissena polymorpha TaxID=45954 RepID=A0A9D3YS35_DREPO|nr:hypothetical protein DPMN_078229 [Dreissena polymorpha]
MMEGLSNKEFENSVMEEMEKICEDTLTPLEPDKSILERDVKSVRQMDFNLDRKKSLSFDWSEFEKVFAEDFNSKAGFERLVSFLSEINKIIAKYLKSERDDTTKVLDFHHPHQLREMMDHCLYVDDQPHDLEQLLSDCNETLKYCVKTAHPRFMNQISTGIDIVGMAGEWVTAAANTNMFTYEIAPVFTLMEEIVQQRMKQLIGWPEGDAIFAPGGAISNLYAVLVARHVINPDIKHDGMYGVNKLAIFTSVQSHFSIKKAAVLLGIGLNNVYSIDTDSRGRMDALKLEEAIQRAMAAGVRPLLVNATCGTTVLGAYDPLNPIADICEKYGVWMHVDGAWGGSVLFSDKYRHLLEGIHRADSMTWNPHKMMGVPLQCSAIFVKKKGVLESVNGLRADYLYQSDKMYDTSYDTGDKAIQCGRHNDIFKLWLMWRSKVFRRKKLVIRLANAGGLAGWLAGGLAGWLAGWRNKLAAARSKSEAALVSAMTNVYFAAQHTLASSLVPDLNRLCVLQGATQLNDLRVDSHTSYEHSSSVSEFQNCMADVLRSDLQKIQTSCKYSIMIDESTDISVKQNLVTYVRL